MNSSTATSGARQQTWISELALKVALNNIARNSFIDDRSTKLTCREVCREWRAHSCFSDAITSVTLNSISHAQKLIEYYSLVPRIRSPWQTLEDSRVFMNLRTVHMSPRLGTQLKNFADVDSFVAVCRQFDVTAEVQNCTKDIEAPLQVYSAMGTVSSFIVGREASPWKRDPEHDVLFYEEGFKSILGLEQLMSLTFRNADFTGVLKELTSLKSLRELRQLRLELKILDLDMELRNVVTLLAALTHVTHVDLRLEICEDGFAKNPMAIFERRLLEQAPESLKQCHFCFEVPIFRIDYRNGIALNKATYKPRKLYDCHFSFSMVAGESIQENGALVEDYLKVGLAGRDVQRICIDLSRKRGRPITQLLFGSKTLMDIKELELEVRVDGYKGGIVVLGPLFVKEDDIPMFTTRLKLRFYVDFYYCGIEPEFYRIDCTRVLDNLPSVLPHLQQLLLIDTDICPANLSVLRQLSALTYLSLKTNDSHGETLLDLSGLPLLLKRLHVHTYSLAPALTPPLHHLTRLELELGEDIMTYLSQQVTGQLSCNVSCDNALSFFSQCAAPLKDLVVNGHVSLDTVVTHFPHLEKLAIFRYTGEPSSLAALKLLRKLALWVTTSKLSQLTELTQVRNLDFEIEDHFEVYS